MSQSVPRWIRPWLALSLAIAAGAEEPAMTARFAKHPMPDPAAQPGFSSPAPGFRGIWHGQTPTDDEWRYKYSGGLGTYCAKHRPLAVHCPSVEKTFFVWGGTGADRHERKLAVPRGQHQPRGSLHGEGQLFHCIAVYDHARRAVSRPVSVFDKWCADPHDNPVLAVAADGHLWMFSPSHGEWTTDSFVLRSREPYDHTAWEVVERTLFAYPQPWALDGGGFGFFSTRYQDGRGLWFARGDGRQWDEPVHLAFVEKGHYQVSNRRGDKLVTVFNRHPERGGLEARTDLYLVQTADGGATWTSVDGKELAPPLKAADNPARIRDYAAENRLVYLKDLQFDAAGNPAILYVTSAHNLPGPRGDPRTLTLARWSGNDWSYTEICPVDNNYDAGQLHVAGDTWTVVAPTEPGPQPGNPGGEMVMWRSEDGGSTWTRVKQLTAGSRYNHTYARIPVDAHEDFFAFWSDGDCRAPSKCHLYFCDAAGEVRRLPWTMAGEWTEGEVVGP